MSNLRRARATASLNASAQSSFQASTLRAPSTSQLALERRVGSTSVRWSVNSGSKSLQPSRIFTSFRIMAWISGSVRFFFFGIQALLGRDRKATLTTEEHDKRNAHEDENSSEN